MNTATEKSAYEMLFNAKLLDTHWGVRIANAEENEHFTDADVSDAASWVTCACGKSTRAIRFLDDKVYDGEPNDYKLARLGKMFYSYVGENSFTDAAETLIAIENRAAALHYEKVIHNEVK